MTFIVISIEAGRSYDDRIYDGKDTLASDIFTSDAFQLAVRQNSSLIQVHTPSVNRASEWHLVRMKVLEAGSSDDILRTIPKDVGYRVRCK